ncbi:hypothetical protein KCU98_g229, partial [Aureobasidium melanogenum]
LVVEAVVRHVGFTCVDLKASTGATSSIVARFRFLSTVVFCVCGSLMVRVASPPSACRARKAMSSIVCASLPFCAAGSGGSAM